MLLGVGFCCDCLGFDCRNVAAPVLLGCCHRHARSFHLKLDGSSMPTSIQIFKSGVRGALTFDTAVIVGGVFQQPINTSAFELFRPSPTFIIKIYINKLH